METLRLKVRQPAEDPVESWDDGDFMMDGDEFALRNNSGASRPPSRRRDSGSSHMSLRSDLESWTGEDERQVHIPGDDEKSTSDAIFAAQSAGIPLPKNIPSSALMGGTIKRLGGKKLRKIIQEDWENDLELPDTTQGFKIKFQRHSDFPETLRQVSTGSVHSSPVKMGQTSPRALGQALVPRPAAMINLLDKFKDNEDDDFFGDGCETIKISKQRPAPKPVSLITPPTPSKNEGLMELEDDFEKDLELPSHGKLQLSTRRDIPKTPSAYSDDLDWGEGSLGTRFGGTRRDGRSHRSSSGSALSPSVSSSITMESEDETFDGLVLPAGPVNFQERLQQRKKSRSPQRIPEEGPSPPKRASTAEADKPDFLDGLDFGDGDPFNAGKLTLHKNIKVKETRPISPARPKTAVSLTFTNKPVNTRIPRLSHERAHSTSLEPVSESGGPIPPRTRRPQSRMGHTSHTSQSSVTSIPTPTTPSPNSRFPPSTPSRRELTSKVSTPSMRAEPTTTSAQLLKQKRSLPAIRALGSKNHRFDSSSSRLDHRSQTGVRPKTPVEQPRASMDSSAQPTRKKSQPFLPAGASSSQSQHINAKTVRQLRRHDSDNALDLRPHSRAFSRSTMRSPSPQQRLRVAADTWERLSKPKSKKQFGDGHELDAFDDLPTSKETETRFLRQPVGTNGSKPLLRRAGPSITDRMNTPSPHMSTKSLSTPRFARDTTASRIARETSLANRNSISGPLAPVNAQRAVQSSPAQAPALSIRTTPNIHSSAVRSKKSKRPVQQKPHLISNLNAGKESKTVNGMFYNADTYRWEGNENALSAFDAGVVTPIAAPSALLREKETTTPRPALITNISTTKGVQVVNGMVFDPSSMCWLKLGAQQEGPKSDKSDPLENFNALDDDEDVFKDIPDLEEITGDEEGQGRVSDINDDWLVGEEFDVGPEFIRRQREEEDRWRKKCGKWVGRGTRDRESWRWTIRELVSQFDELPM
ncbi:unnamed protein product [Clonostachys rosea]|uniref:Cytokinesis inhibitor byr4 n=1 Tax=Bionectria ochroleuca TaxID=29856 RepID=A0ABY6TX99_BIOOC|nr:unnamed protein product [Clonostachys rosea]